MTLDFNNVTPLETTEARTKRVREQVLNGRLEDLLRHIYGQNVVFKGYKSARIGNINGDPGESLSIALQGHSAGLWKEFADNGNTIAQGDFIHLWRHIFSQTHAEAVKDIDQWMNGKITPQQIRNTQKQAAKPKPRETYEVEAESYAYHTVTGEHVYDVVRFNKFYEDTGEPVLNSRGRPRKEYKPRRPGGTSARLGYPPGLRLLYRLPDIEPSDHVILCEGEKAADAVYLAGFPATSAPGGSSTDKTKIDWRPLAGKTVTLWPDNDEEGRKFMVECATLLTELGCKVQTLDVPDIKDSGDAADLDDDEIRALLNGEESVQPVFDALDWPDIDYAYEPERVEDLLPESGLATIYGPSSGGKSFIALDWCASIARGADLFGKESARAGIVYCAFEGFHGLKKRIHGYKQDKGCGDLPFRLIDAPWTLTEAEDIAAFESALGAAQRDFEANGTSLGVVVVDTLTAASAGSDANSQADVTKFMRMLKLLARRLGVLILIVGHTGKDAARGMVGSFAYKSESDAFIEVRVDENKRRSLYVDKVKDGRSDYTISDYELREIRIGTKPNGKPITTCVVDWIEPAEDAIYENDTLEKHAHTVRIRLATGPKTIKELGEQTTLSRPYLHKILSQMIDNGEIIASTQGRSKMYQLSQPFETHKSEEKQ